MRWRFCVLACLVLGACGLPQGGRVPPQADAYRHLLETQTVMVRDFAFSPAELRVPVGTTVVWRFDGPTSHTTTSDPGSKVTWDSGLLGTGSSYSVTFNQRGTYPYHCTPHANMHGVIIVR